MQEDLAWSFFILGDDSKQEQIENGTIRKRIT